jgi:hypothetical protein
MFCTLFARLSADLAGQQFSASREIPISSCCWKRETFMNIVNNEVGFEKRVAPRKPYSGNIFFTTKNGLNEGRLKNFSRYGLFIETKAWLSEGEVITVALPHLNGKNIKCKGQIMWRNSQGCGIELFRKRSPFNFRIIK